MGSLRGIVRGAAGLSAVTGALAVTGRLGVVLLAFLVALMLALAYVLVLTAVFGRRERQNAAMRVLRLLLGRKNKPR